MEAYCLSILQASRIALVVDKTIDTTPEDNIEKPSPNKGFGERIINQCDAIANLLHDDQILREFVE